MRELMFILEEVVSLNDAHCKIKNPQAQKALEDSAQRVTTNIRKYTKHFVALEKVKNNLKEEFALQRRVILNHAKMLMLLLFFPALANATDRDTVHVYLETKVGQSIRWSPTHFMMANPQGDITAMSMYINAHPHITPVYMGPFEGYEFLVDTCGVFVLTGEVMDVDHDGVIYEELYYIIELTVHPLTEEIVYVDYLEEGTDTSFFFNCTLYVVRYDKKLRVYIPNAIRINSPSPDNSSFRSFSNRADIYPLKLEIYDRWGGLMSVDCHHYGDSYLELPSGVYLYVLSGKNIMFHGDITLFE